MWEALSQPVCQRATMALAHFLWQALAIGVVLWCVLAFAPSARRRYAASLAALGLMGLSPILTFVLLSVPPLDARGQMPVRELAAVGSEQTAVWEGVGCADDPMDSPVGHAADAPLRPSLKRVLSLQAIQPFALLTWLGGVVAFGARLAMAFPATWRLRRDRRPLPQALAHRAAQIAQRIGLGPDCRVFASMRVVEAAVVGLLRPAVLLPVAWLAEMRPGELEAVIAHELAHIRRLDLWANVVQRLVETLWFYHPAVWWVSRRVNLEREMCCDELAVAATGRRMEYAKALETLGRRSSARSSPVLATSLSFLGERKMNVLRRVHNVLGLHPAWQPRRWWPVGLIAIVALLAIWAVAAGLLPLGQPALADGERAGDPPVVREGERGDRPVVREGDRGPREGERAPREGDRAPREGDRGPREGDRLPREGDRGPREGDRGPREGDRGPREGDRGPREGEGLGDFRPQTPREAALYRMVLELRRELIQLRREVEQLKGRARFEGDRDRPGPREGDAARRGPREGEGVRRGPREADAPARTGPRDGEGGVRSGPRDGEGPVKPGPRDGEGGVRRGPRDGEGPARQGPRDPAR